MKDDEQTSEPEPDPADKYFDLGGGIDLPKDVPLHPSDEKAKFEDEKPETDRDIKREYNYVLNDDRKKHFVDEPCYPDQYARYPETVKRVGPMIQVFDTASPDDLHELNTLMSGAQNHSAPRSMVAIMDKQWAEKSGGWKILAQVYKFKYLNILERD